MSLADDIRELDEVNMLLQFIERDILDAGFPTREQLDERSELTKKAVEIVSRIPDVIGNV